MLAIAGALAIPIAAEAAPAAAAGWDCEASAARVVPSAGSGVEPAVANRGVGSCKPALKSFPIAVPPLPVTGGVLTARTGVTGAGVAQQVDAVGEVADLHIATPPGVALPALPALPSNLGAVNVPLPAVPGLALPSSITLDLRPALQGQLPSPVADLLHVQQASARAHGSCSKGSPALSGNATVAGLSVLGQTLDVDQLFSSVLKLRDAANIDPAAADLSKVALPAGLSFDDPVVGPVLRGAVGNVLGAMPKVAIPPALADVTVTPKTQTNANGRLTQRALTVQVSTAGQKLLDAVLGEASVAATGATCATSAADLALQCTTRKIVLIDVLDQEGRVQLMGAAERQYVGRRVGIRFTATGKTVAHATVGKDGLFSAAAPLPARSVRGTNRARYQAYLGSERSLRLKLHRRMIVTSMTSADGRVMISGRVRAPLTDSMRSIVIKRRVSCTRSVEVGQIRPSSDGRFHATVAAPPDQQAAVYRLQTSVPKSAHGSKVFPTFTLPRVVELLR